MSEILSPTHIKGTEALIIRRLLQLTEHSVEAFCEHLSPASRTAFEQATSDQWILENDAAEFYTLAAQTLFPNQDDDLEHLGRTLAQNSLGGIYKTILAITSVTFLIKRTPLLWTLYHSAGKAEVIITPGKHQGRMLVREAPGMSLPVLRTISGFSIQALELAGGLFVTCQLNAKNPEAWEWLFDWEE